MSAALPASESQVSGSRQPSRRLTDHLAVVTTHWLIFSALSLAVFGAVLIPQLLATPRAQAAAVIQLVNDAGTGLAGAGASAEVPQSKLENEVAEARALDLAREAAADKVLHLTCVIEQQDAYRVLDLALRSIGHGREPCLLEATTPDALPAGEAALEVYRMRFNLSGEGLSVEGVTGVSGTEAVHAFDWGKPFRALGRTFLLGRREPIRGSHAGRSFLVSVRSVESAARWIREGARVTPLGAGSDMFRIGFSSEEPEVARSVAEALATAYLQRSAMRYHESIHEALGALGKQIARVDGELTEAQQERDTYVQEHDAVFLGSEKSGLLQSRTTKADQILQLKQSLESLEAGHARVMKLKGVPLADSMDELLAVQPDALLQSLWSAARDVRRMRAAALKNNAKELAPEILKYDRQVEALEEEIQAGLERLFRLAEERAGRERAALQAQLERAQGDVVAINARLAAIPEIERTLNVLDRKIDSQRQILDSLQARKSSLEILEGSNRKPTRLIEQALPGEPEYSLLKALLLALVLGFGAGVAGAVGLDALRAGVRSPEALEDLLRVPVYAAVPDFGTVPRSERSGVKGGLIALHRPRSGLAECYWQLRAKFLFMGPERRVRCLAVTSAMELEGKTVTVLNLAAVLAQSGASVVVVDGDLRRPQCHKHLQMDLTPGLREVLAGETSFREAVKATRYERVHLLPAGRLVSKPGGLFDVARIGKLIEDLKQEYDHVLVDLPPVLAVSDPAGAMRAFEGVLLVVRARKTAPAAVEEAKRELDQLGGRVLGSVFNGYDVRRFRGRNYGYGRYFRADPEEVAPAQPPVRLKHVRGE